MNLDLEKLKEIDIKGGIFIYPTDTVLGIGTNIMNYDGIVRINQLKQRSENQSFIILVSSIEMLSEYVEKIPEAALKLLENPAEACTIIYSASDRLPEYLKADDGTIAIRLIQNQELQTMIETIAYPVISTSANFKGQSPARTMEELDPELIKEVDYVVTEFIISSTAKKPSKIIKIGEDGSLILIRE